MKKALDRFAILLFLFVIIAPIASFAQGPVPCNDPLSCGGLCKPGGVECWDIDDPVPLDNGLLFLVGGAVAFGLYRLNMRRQQA